MPFGLKNTPSTFQRNIQNALGDLIMYKGCINYLYDFIIYSKNFEEHITLLDKFFFRLKSQNIKLKLSKYLFAKEEVEYLGHVIRHNSVKPTPKKTKPSNHSRSQLRYETYGAFLV